MTKKITPQRVFDAAWQAFVVEDGLPAQEQDPQDGVWECKYMTSDGRRCAFGLLMTPEEARGNDGVSASSVVINGAKPGGPGRAFDSLQFELHDMMCEEGQWVSAFSTQEQRAAHYRKVAAEHGLTVPE